MQSNQRMKKGSFDYKLDYHGNRINPSIKHVTGHFQV